MAHEIKKADDILCAVVTIDGAWLDMVERKLYTPKEEVINCFQQMPIDENFQWLN